MKSKNVIRINESQLKQMISESVKKVLKEDNFFNQWENSFNTGNHKEVMKTYNSLLKLKNTLPLLYFTDRLSNDVATKLRTAADILDKYLTDDVMNSIVNFYKQNSQYKDKKPLDLSIPFAKRHSNEFNEPEDWYERVEHGDFDNY